MKLVFLLGILLSQFSVAEEFRKMPGFEATVSIRNIFQIDRTLAKGKYVFTDSADKCSVTILDVQGRMSLQVNSSPDEVGFIQILTGKVYDSIDNENQFVIMVADKKLSLTYLDENRKVMEVEFVNGDQVLKCRINGAQASSEI